MRGLDFLTLDTVNAYTEFKIRNLTKSKNCKNY